MTRRAQDFDTLYRTDPDPFGVGTRWYEQRKLAIALASLAEPRYPLAWDCASGTGHLAEALGGRCDRVLASDAAPEAVRITAERTSALDAVRVEVSALPDRPEQARDAGLTVVSEVLYYLDDDTRRTCLAMLADQSGELLSVHWAHHPHDAHLSGVAVTAELSFALRSRGWSSLVTHREDDFVLASWRSASR